MTAWTIQPTNFTYGLVRELDIAATRKCGKTVNLTAYHFPAGWRMNGAGVPKTVAAAALKMAREDWNW